ncbi:hypothetical protein [Calidithermus chliarophilus]|uniref:hypothetical protein n=1 Tax=Calidithermus chliarophilus TaxID=52023 RepID=UPI000481233C|nr:hypothetical protein [Calidithermus chliarophilus]
MKRFLLLVLTSLVLAACVPSTSSSRQAGPFQVGQTWELTGRWQNTTHVFLLNLREKKPYGESYAYEDVPELRLSGNLFYYSAGIFYTPKEAAAIATIITDPQKRQGAFCYIENAVGPAASFEGRYLAGDAEELSKANRTKDFSKFGTCTLKLK